MRPVRVVVLAINWTITWWVSRGLPRQFWVMKANSRCSIRFHLTRLFGLRPLRMALADLPAPITPLPAFEAALNRFKKAFEESLPDPETPLRR